MCSRRIPAVLLVTLALAGSLLACGDDGSDVTAESTTSTPAATDTSPDTSDASTSSVAPDTTSPTSSEPTTSVPGDPTGSCDEGTTLAADVDGDGSVDAVALVTDPSAPTSELRACTSAGASTLDALGASTVEAVDIDGDGASELLYGGTGATGRTVQVARWIDGGLVTVGIDGGPLLLTDGYPDGMPPDGPRHAFGCGGTVDGNPVQLIVLRVRPINAAEFAFSLDATGYMLDEGEAAVVATESVTSPAGTPGGTSEELAAYANEIVAENAPAC